MLKEKKDVYRVYIPYIFFMCVCCSVCMVFMYVISPPSSSPPALPPLHPLSLHCLLHPSNLQARGLRRGLSDTRKSDLYIPAEFLQRRRLGHNCHSRWLPQSSNAG